MERMEPLAVDKAPVEDPRAYGLFVLDGLIGARASVGREGYIEVLGAGDVLRPWAEIDAGAPLSPDYGWRAFAETRLLVLDHRFALGVAPWPQITAALMHRFVLRARRLGFQLVARSPLYVRTPRSITATAVTA